MQEKRIALASMVLGFLLLAGDMINAFPADAGMGLIAGAILLAGGLIAFAVAGGTRDASE